jgi:hypothetical protein
MFKLSELYAEQRRADELREAQREANKNALLAKATETETKTPPRRVRKAVGGKLIEWGTRLQETPQATH